MVANDRNGSLRLYWAIRIDISPFCRTLLRLRLSTQNQPGRHVQHLSRWSRWPIDMASRQVPSDSYSEITEGTVFDSERTWCELVLVFLWHRTPSTC